MGVPSDRHALNVRVLIVRSRRAPAGLRPRFGGLSVPATGAGRRRREPVASGSSAITTRCRSAALASKSAWSARAAISSNSTAYAVAARAPRLVRGRARPPCRIGVVGSPTSGRVRPSTVNACRGVPGGVGHQHLDLQALRRPLQSLRRRCRTRESPCCELRRVVQSRVVVALDRFRVRRPCGRLAGTPRAAVSPGDGRGVLAHPRLCPNSTSAYADAQERIWRRLHQVRGRRTRHDPPGGWRVVGANEGWGPSFSPIVRSGDDKVLGGFCQGSVWPVWPVGPGDPNPERDLAVSRGRSPPRA